MELKNCIFDMDGTLVDSMGYWQGLERDFLIRHGAPDTPALNGILEQAKPLPLIQAAEVFIQHCGLPDTPEQARAEMMNVMKGHYQRDVQLKPGVVEYLTSLKHQGARMCVVTATPRHLVEICLSRFDLFPYFDFLLTCDEVGTGKNHPDVFFEAARRLNAAPAQIAVFEDSLQAAQTAKKAGFYTVGIYDQTGAVYWDALSAIADETRLHW